MGLPSPWRFPDLVTLVDLPLRPLYHLRDSARTERWRKTTGKPMTMKSLLVAGMSVGAIVGIAGCGGSSTTSTPTPSSGGLTLPGILGNGSNGSAPAATTLLTAAEVQTISGDPSVTALAGACTSTTCVYSDTTGTGGGGGVVFVQPFPGALAQGVLQGAIASALSGQSTGNGGATTAVSGLGSGAIKEIDTNSATYAFVKDNYLVVINVTSGSKSGADMDSQVGAAAQTIAGSV
jgi:hypothetical protein